MIAEYGENISSDMYLGGRQYALGQTHKHLPEMLKVCGLSVAPAFCPIIVPHFSGMETTVTLFSRDLRGTPDDIRALYSENYPEGGLVRFAADPSESGVLSSAALAGRDDMQVSVYGNSERILLVARFDNLGKGASGAAIQNMNLVLGCDERTGLSWR